MGNTLYNDFMKADVKDGLIKDLNLTNERGVAFVVSNEYSGSNKPSSIDSKNMKELFEEPKINYSVHVGTQVSYKEFIATCKYLATYEGYPPTCKVILIYFSGHGNNKYITMEDKKSVSLLELRALFTNTEIVKLFLIDSCSGLKLDSGYRQASQGNDLIAYATSEGYSAYHDKDGGSWTNTLISQIREMDDKPISAVFHNLHKLMNYKEHGSKKDGSQFFQVPELRNRLIGDVYFWDQQTHSGPGDHTDSSRDANESFSKMLVELGIHTEGADDSLVKRFKMSLRFLLNITVPKKIYEAASNIPDILKNLVHHGYVTVDDVNLLDTIVKTAIPDDDDQHRQKKQCVLEIIEEYKKSIVLCNVLPIASISKDQYISITSNSQCIIVSTSHAASCSQIFLKEVGNIIFSALSLSNSCFSFFVCERYEFCLRERFPGYLNGYHLELPNHDYCLLLKRLGVLTIEVKNGFDDQIVDLQSINYTGCLLLPKNRSTKKWVAKFFCVPAAAGYEEDLQLNMPSTWEVLFYPIGFESLVHLTVLAPDFTEYGWTVDFYGTIDKLCVDEAVHVKMLRMLPYILIEVQTTGKHHSVSFPDCKVLIEGSCYNQSFMLTSTLTVEEAEDMLEAKPVSDVDFDKLFPIDGIYTKEQQTVTMPQQTTSTEWQKSNFNANSEVLDDKDV